MTASDLAVPPEYERAMRLALEEAALARETGDIPIGAVVLDADGRVIGRGRNTREAEGDPVGHAEVNALREAARSVGAWRLEGCALVATLEPCPMCAGAALAAHVGTVVFGAWDEKGGAVGSRYDLVRDRRLPARATVYAGVLEGECAALLTEFFRTGLSRPSG